jgi:sulfur carrier protein ThiS
VITVNGQPSDLPEGTDVAEVVTALAGPDAGRGISVALNGEVYVTADGPDGPALYRLADKNRDGVLEDVRPLIRFECEVLEHGGEALDIPSGVQDRVTAAREDGERR